MASWDVLESINHKGTQVNLDKEKIETSNVYKQVDPETEVLQQDSSESMHGTTTVQDCKHVQIGDRKEQHVQQNVTGSGVAIMAENLAVYVQPGGSLTIMSPACVHTEGRPYSRKNKGITDDDEDNIRKKLKEDLPKMKEEFETKFQLKFEGIEKGSIIFKFEVLNEADAAKLKQNFESGLMFETIIERILTPEQRDKYAGKTLDVSMNLEESQIKVCIAVRKGEGQQSCFPDVTEKYESALSSSSALYQEPVKTSKNICRDLPQKEDVNYRGK